MENLLGPVANLGGDRARNDKRHDAIGVKMRSQVPEPIAAGAVKAGKLVRVLGPFAPMAPGVFLYPGHRQIMPKLRAFIDHVKSRSNVANKIHIRAMHRRTEPARPLPRSPDVA